MRMRGRSLAGEKIRGELFTAKDGLTSDIVTGSFEDREGNIWITTALGVDMFRRSAVVPVRLPKSRFYTFLDAAASVHVASEFPSRIFTLNDGKVVHSEALPVDTFSAHPRRARRHLARNSWSRANPLFERKVGTGEVAGNGDWGHLGRPSRKVVGKSPRQRLFPLGEWQVDKTG